MGMIHEIIRQMKVEAREAKRNQGMSQFTGRGGRRSRRRR